MKIHKKNYIWITALSISGLLLLNILISLNSHHKIEGKISFTELPSAIEDNKPIEPTTLSLQPVQKQGSKQFSHLELLGTLIGNSSLAFIYNSDTKTQGLYRINDLIGDLKIVNIFPGKVLLEKDGASHELLLIAGSRNGVGDNRPVVATDDDGTMIISKLQILSQLMRANELLTKVKILPLPDVASNKLKGFRIDNVPPGSIIEEAGIRNGDIIYSVQGQKLQSMQDALQMFNRIQSQPRIEVVLLRGDKPITLRYEIRN
jgi:general secretion pathway protein C